MEKLSSQTRFEGEKIVQSAVNKPQRIKIFSLNCYLVSDLALSTDERKFCCDKQIRAQKIGKFAAQYDVIALQEVWGDSLWSLEQELLDDHDRSFNSYTYSFSLLNVISLWLKATGGLWLAARRSTLPILRTRRVQFKHSLTRSRKGSSYMLLDTKAMWNDNSYLLMVNTHLDPTNAEHSQEIQLEELIQFIEESLHDVQRMVNSLNKVALLLCGDFNINGNSKQQYEFLINALGNGVRDLGLEWAISQNISPENTFSDRYKDGSANRYHAWDGEQRLDYFFTFDNFQLDGNRVDLLSIGGEVTVYNSPEYDFSDHFALTCELFPIKS